MNSSSNRVVRNTNHLISFRATLRDVRGGVDSDHALFCLEDYLATYYPDGPAARKALACIERIKCILFRDEEVPELIRAIVDGVSPSDGSRGLSFNVYPDALRTVSAIAEEFGSALSDGITPLVDAMRCAVERDPEAAVKSVRNNRVEWQEVPFDPSGVFELPKIKEVDELRDHALKTLVRRRSESLNDVMKNASVQLVDNLYKALDEFGDSREAVSLLVSLDASWFAVAMAKMPPRKDLGYSRVVCREWSCGDAFPFAQEQSG